MLFSLGINSQRKDLFTQLTPFCYCLLLSHVLLFCDPMDCSPPGSSVHGIFQARRLEWVAISFCKASSQPRDRTPVNFYVSCMQGRFLTTGSQGHPVLCFSIKLSWEKVRESHRKLQFYGGFPDGSVGKNSTYLPYVFSLPAGKIWKNVSRCSCLRTSWRCSCRMITNVAEESIPSKCGWASLVAQW